MSDPTPTPDPTSVMGSAPAPTPAAPAPAPASVMYPDATPPGGEAVAPAEVAPKADGSGTPEAAPPPALTPEAYELKMPEGFTPDESLLTEFRSTAANAKLDNATAQSLIDFHAKALTAQAEAFSKQQSETWTATQKTWQNELNAMPEFTGANREQNLAALARALDEYGTPEVRQALEVTGAGNNPQIVKMFLSMAKALGEGGPVPQGSPRATTGTRGRTPGQVFYPSTPN